MEMLLALVGMIALVGGAVLIGILMPAPSASDNRGDRVEQSLAPIALEAAPGSPAARGELPPEFWEQLRVLEGKLVDP
jgi:hypothetical protein